MAKRKSAHTRRSEDKRADELLRMLDDRPPSPDHLELLHELEVAHEELLAQNEGLIRARATLEEARDLYADLYDFAPNGYLTLDANGIVLQINLTGAALLGRRREAIEGMPLLSFTADSAYEPLFDFLRRCRANKGEPNVVGEISIQTPDGRRDMQLLSRPPKRQAEKSRRFFAAMIDVTDRRILAAERDIAAREQTALASRLISIQEEERQRIARDLHDNIGQQVTALRLILDSVAKGSAGRENQHRILQAQSIVTNLDAQLDFLTGELRPVSLDLGAVSAIRQFVEEWSRTFSIDARVQCDGLEDLRLDPEVETHLYRVVQEALNNVSKHAQAHHVGIDLSRHDSLLVMTISDDGTGFDTSARGSHRPHHHGLGLLGMRERAQIVNGTLEIRTAPGAGTTIVFHVPVRSSLAQAG